MADLAATREAPKHPSKDEICQSLLASDASDFFNDKQRVEISKAAVLIPLFLKDDELFVLLTVRSRHLRTHGGEVAFPGGKEDEEDKDIVETALREAEEEIGLPRGQVEVISRLPPSIAKYGIVVIPVVGFISKDFVPQPNPDEVEYAFSVPLADFLCSENHSSQHSTWDGRHYIMQLFFPPASSQARKGNSYLRTDCTYCNDCCYYNL